MVGEYQSDTAEIERAKQAILGILPGGPEWIPKVELVRLLEKVRPSLGQNARILARDGLIGEELITDKSGYLRRIIYYDNA